MDVVRHGLKQVYCVTERVTSVTIAFRENDPPAYCIA